MDTIPALKEVMARVMGRVFRLLPQSYVILQCPRSLPLSTEGAGLYVLAFPRSALKQTFPL
jgi:hypothetical protein